MTQQNVIRFKTFNPRRNLPEHIAQKRTESIFLGAFERYLLSSVFPVGSGGRYFSMASYGIADFVWMLPKKKHTHYQPDGVLYAFETKMKDWRRALQQAYRYSYFSDISLVVLPPKSGSVALSYMSIFKINNIGLWIFNQHENVLHKAFTPRKFSARNPQAKAKAIRMLGSRIKLSQFPEKTDTLAYCR